MRECTSRWLLSAGLVGITLCFYGCAPGSSPGHARSRRAGNPAEVASPLTSSAPRPELLAGINSIEIARPSVASSTGQVSIDPADAQRMIEQVARETMTLKISMQGTSTSGTNTRKAGAGTMADAVLHTELLRFEERQGSAIGGEPAVISFRMSMKASPSGPEVWGAQYFFRQEALSENLLKINQRVGKGGLGAGWRSASDVFQKGVSLALQDFSTQREQRYLASGR
jgi:hypothetical protein